MGKGLFIAGTDTGVGKTIVSAGIIKWARGHGYSAVGFKPVETGCSKINGKLWPEDGSMLVKASEYAIDLDDCAPYRFELPAAPARAAKNEGKNLNVRDMARKAETIKNKFQMVVVEAAGGLMVPVNERELIIDLAAELGYPVILVARTRLGTINHTLLSLKALLSRNLEVTAVVLSASSEEIGPEERYTCEDLAGFLNGRPLLLLPHLDSDSIKAPGKIAAIIAREWGDQVLENITQIKGRQ